MYDDFDDDEMGFAPEEEMEAQPPMPGQMRPMPRPGMPMEQDLGPMTMEDVLDRGYYKNPVREEPAFDISSLDSYEEPMGMEEPYSGQSPMSDPDMGMSLEQVKATSMDMLGQRAKKRMAASEHFQQQASKLAKGY